MTPSTFISTSCSPEPGRGDLARALVHRQLTAGARARHHHATREHQLQICAEPAEGLRRRLSMAAPGSRSFPRPAPSRAAAATPLDRELGALAQRLVHLPAQLSAHAEIHGRRRRDHRQRHRQARGRRDPGAKRHGSRSTAHRAPTHERARTASWSFRHR